MRSQYSIIIIRLDMGCVKVLGELQQLNNCVNHVVYSWLHMSNMCCLYVSGYNLRKTP